MRRRLHSREGASAIEFALVLPLLVLFLFGIIEFGLAFARSQGMEAAAREGARLASIGRSVDDGQVAQAARDASPPFIRNEDIAVTISPAGNWCAAQGERVTVRVEIAAGQRDRYRLNIPLFNAGEPPSYAAEGVFRCETRRSSGGS